MSKKTLNRKRSLVTTLLLVMMLLPTAVFAQGGGT